MGSKFDPSPDMTSLRPALPLGMFLGALLPDVDVTFAVFIPRVCSQDGGDSSDFCGLG